MARKKEPDFKCKIEGKPESADSEKNGNTSGEVQNDEYQFRSGEFVLD